MARPAAGEFRGRRPLRPSVNGNLSWLADGTGAIRDHEHMRTEKP
jgi:hypothetical protein